MYEYEEVTEQEAKAFAKDIGAIFQTTSAKLSNGVDELLRMIGKKFVNPDAENVSNLTKEEMEQRKKQIKIKEIKKEEQKNPKVSRRKEIKKIKGEINKIEVQKTIEKNNKTKSWFFEKVNKIDKPLARLTKKRRENKQTK